MKNSGRRKGKSVRANKTKLGKAVETFRLDQPIQTALYAKLFRLGYDA